MVTVQLQVLVHLFCAAAGVKFAASNNEAATTAWIVLVVLVVSKLVVIVQSPLLMRRFCRARLQVSCSSSVISDQIRPTVQSSVFKLRSTRLTQAD